MRHEDNLDSLLSSCRAYPVNRSTPGLPPAPDTPTHGDSSADSSQDSTDSSSGEHLRRPRMANAGHRSNSEGARRMQHPPRAIGKHTETSTSETSTSDTRAPMRPETVPKHRTQTAQPEPTNPLRPRCVVAIPIHGGSCGRDRSLRSPTNQRPMTSPTHDPALAAALRRGSAGVVLPKDVPAKSNRGASRCACGHRANNRGGSRRWSRPLDGAMFTLRFSQRPRLTSAPDADLILPS